MANSENNLRKYLTPFADGELNVEQSLRVLEHMAMDPQAAKRVLHQQQLRQSIARHLTTRTPATPEELRKRLEATFPQAPAIEPARRQWGAWSFARLVIGTSAALATGIWIGKITATHPTPAVSSATAPSTAGPIPGTITASITRAHVNCSRYASHDHSKLFPPRLAQLPAALEKFLGHPARAPNFTGMGFDFVGAEECPVIGGKTAHLLYRAHSGAVHETISLFMQPDEGQIGIERGRALYTHNSHPTAAWRASGVVYYLVGDAQETVKRAAKLSGAPE